MPDILAILLPVALALVAGGIVGWMMAVNRGQRELIHSQQDEPGRLLKQYREGEAYGAEMAWRAARGEKPAAPDIPVVGTMGGEKRKREKLAASGEVPPQKAGWQQNPNMPRA